MSPLRPHMLAALHLRGNGERTQEASVREVRLLAPFYPPSPDRLSEPALQRDFLHRKHVDGLAPASLRLCSSGIRFFSQHVLQRDWHTLSLLRAPTAQRLPAVLRVEEVRRLLTSATPFHNHGDCTPVSRLGLRLHAALSLQGADSDGPRLQVHGHRGKGATDRDVPLPAETLARLRTSWHTPRHQTWLCPATGRDHHHSPTAPSPLRRTRVQGACRTATHRAGLTTLGGAIPPLRQASATPLLEAGVPPRLIQRSLGPTPLATTMVSLHLPHKGHEEAYERLNALRHGLLP
jgi:integrase/recombinase XerD